MAKAAPPRKRGRPPKLGDDEGVYVTLPKRQYDYLALLALRGDLGTSASDVAAHILIRELSAMLHANFHEKEIPSV